MQASLWTDLRCRVTTAFWLCAYNGLVTVSGPSKGTPMGLKKRNGSLNQIRCAGRNTGQREVNRMGMLTKFLVPKLDCPHSEDSV